MIVIYDFQHMAYKVLQIQTRTICAFMCFFIILHRPIFHSDLRSFEGNLYESWLPDFHFIGHKCSFSQADLHSKSRKACELKNFSRFVSCNSRLKHILKHFVLSRFELLKDETVDHGWLWIIPLVPGKVLKMFFLGMLDDEELDCESTVASTVGTFPCLLISLNLQASL